MNRPTKVRDERDAGESARASSTILIVDDDVDAREMLADLLARKGFSVTTRGNGVEGLGYLRTAPAPAVILLDIDMPMMDGYELRARQLAERTLATIPVIVMTDRHAIDRARLGGAPVVHKPFALDQLVATIERVTEGAMRELRTPSSRSSSPDLRRVSAMTSRA